MTKQELLQNIQALEEDARGLLLTHRSTVIGIAIVALIIGFMLGKIL